MQIFASTESVLRSVMVGELLGLIDGDTVVGLEDGDVVVRELLGLSDGDTVEGLVDGDVVVG